jgi:hypothetical protein
MDSLKLRPRAVFNQTAPMSSTRAFNKPGLMTAWDVLRQPMLLLLVVAAIVYLSAGDRIEALPLIASIVVVVGIELYQQIQTEHVLRALPRPLESSCPGNS